MLMETTNFFGDAFDAIALGSEALVKKNAFINYNPPPICEHSGSIEWSNRLLNRHALVFLNL